MNNQPPFPDLRCLFVDMNSYFASCEQEAEPALRGKPVIVAPVMTDTTCAIAASYEAKACGIRTGTPIWEAKKRCPGLIIVPARHRLYTEMHHKIIAAIETCLPVDTIHSIDEMACRLDTVQCEPERARQLALKVKAAIYAQVGDYLKCSIGIASNQLLGKLASDMKKPDGLTVLLPQMMPQAILHLQPRDICGIGRNMNERLRRADIHTVSQLWQADAHALRGVWGGIGGMRFHQMLHGEDVTYRDKRPVRSMGHQHVLPPVERSREKALPILQQLLVRVCQRLRDERMYATHMQVNVKCLPHGHYGDEAIFQETQDTAFLLSILARLWTKAPALKPLRVGVVLCGLAAEAAHQPDLFDRPKPQNLVKAIDALNAKFGRGAVGYGTAAPAMGSKIAFSRIPGLSEF